MNDKTLLNSYVHWLKTVKEHVRTARLKVALAANQELLQFYWDLGKMMSEISETATWGEKLASNSF